jgi:hypothetical protein
MSKLIAVVLRNSFETVSMLAKPATYQNVAQFWCPKTKKFDHHDFLGGFKFFAISSNKHNQKEFAEFAFHTSTTSTKVWYSIHTERI